MTENNRNLINQTSFDTTAARLYNETDVRRIAQEAANQAISQLLEQIIPGVTAHLDNSTSQTQSYPAENRLTLSVPEVAKQIGISAPIAYDLVRKGTIHSIRIGRNILVPRQAVADFLDNCSEV